MYFSPTDEEVETLLGCKVKSWSANLSPLTTQAFDRASKCQNGFLATLLVLGLFICSATLAYIAGKYFQNTIVGSITFLVAGAGALFLLGKINAVAHSKATLGIFEKGMRLGRSIIRFDELTAITLGAPESFEEKYLPTLKKSAEFVAEIKVGVEMMQQSKNVQEMQKLTTMNFHFKDGKVKSWPSFCLFFDPDDFREFCTLLDEKAPQNLSFHDEEAS